MNVTHNPDGGGMNAALADLTEQGYSVSFERAAGTGVFADLCGPSGLFLTTAIGATPAEALAGVWPLDDDRPADTTRPRCEVCGELAGQFDGQVQHWRVVKRVIETFDAGHGPVVASSATDGQ